MTGPFFIVFQARSSSGSPLSQYLYGPPLPGGPGGAPPGSLAPPGPPSGGPPPPPSGGSSSGSGGPQDHPLGSPPPAHVGNSKLRQKNLWQLSLRFKESLFLFFVLVGLRSPLYSLPHTQYPYSMLGAADQLAAW